MLRHVVVVVVVVPVVVVVVVVVVVALFGFSGSWAVVAFATFCR